MTLREELREPVKDADLAFAVCEPLALFIDCLVVVSKTILEAEIGIFIIPHVNGQIASGLCVVFKKDRFAIGRIAPEETSPRTIAAVFALKGCKMRMGDGEFPENIDYRRLDSVLHRRTSD